MMDILFYMRKPENLESTGMRTHVFEILTNLFKMGNTIRYIDGEPFSPVQMKDLSPGKEKNEHKSIFARFSRLTTSSPVKGEAFLIWNFLKEIRIFLTAIITIRKKRPELIYRRHNHFNTDYLVSKLFGIPLVKEVNAIGSDELAISGRADNLSLWFYRISERYSFTRADRLIVVTPELKQQIHDKFSVDENKIIVVQNGANTDIFKPIDQKEARQKLELSLNQRYVVFTGLLKKWQGVEYLIESMPLILKTCPDVRLLIVGDGQIRQELESLAVRTGMLSYIKFTGQVPYETVPLYINAADICAAPFIKEVDKKGGLCSLKLHEYLACGKASVISRLRGIESLEADRCLVSVNPEDAVDLGRTICELIKNDDFRKLIGANGRQYIVEHQTWEKVTERVASVLYAVRDSYKSKEQAK